MGASCKRRVVTAPVHVPVQVGHSCRAFSRGSIAATTKRRVSILDRYSAHAQRGGRSAAMQEPSDNSQYRICIDGILDPRWSAWFDGMQLIREAEHTILLTGRVDQAALYGV